MGYLSAFRNACAVAALAGLTGCNLPAKQSETAELRNKVAALEARITFLETRDVEKSDRLAAIEQNGAVQSNMIGGINQIVSQNARAANENAVKQMNDRGACLPRSCTLADLKP